jgi:hypothetical protein
MAGADVMYRIEGKGADLNFYYLGLMIYPLICILQHMYKYTHRGSMNSRDVMHASR